MKKLFLLTLILFSVLSCSISDDGDVDVNYEILPVDFVEIPSEFIFGETYPITITYTKPEGCYVFSDFYYVSNNNTRTIAIINSVFPYSNCENSQSEEKEVSFNFKANSLGSYEFKFWQGVDENNEDQYLIINVPVIN